VREGGYFVLEGRSAALTQRRAGEMRHNAYIKRVGFAVAIVALMATSTQAQAPSAQARTDIQKGRALAREVCAECHAIRRQGGRSPNGEAPSFASVAATPGMNEMALNVFFQTSHRNMPNIIFTRDQIREISAYILNLKR
jgi:mono/diheme cytochrome c family protein